MDAGLQLLFRCYPAARALDRGAPAVPHQPVPYASKEGLRVVCPVVVGEVLALSSRRPHAATAPSARRAQSWRDFNQWCVPREGQLEPSAAQEARISLKMSILEVKALFSSRLRINGLDQQGEHLYEITLLLLFTKMAYQHERGRSQLAL